MEATKETRKNPDGAQSRAGEAGANLSGGLERDHGIPEILFDGWAVRRAMTDEAQARTDSQSVSDVLDAIVRIMRSNVEVSSRADHFATENPTVARSAAP